MCLITRRDPTAKDKKVKFGYKVFSVFTITYPGELFPEFYGENAYKVNKWYKRRPKKAHILAFDSNKYKSGFHVFATRHGAFQWTHNNMGIKKVKMKNITSVGTQNGCKCYVCDEMRII